MHEMWKRTVDAGFSLSLSPLLFLLFHSIMQQRWRGECALRSERRVCCCFSMRCLDKIWRRRHNGSLKISAAKLLFISLRPRKAKEQKQAREREVRGGRLRAKSQYSSYLAVKTVCVKKRVPESSQSPCARLGHGEIPRRDNKPCERVCVWCYSLAFTLAGLFAANLPGQVEKRGRCISTRRPLTQFPPSRCDHLNITVLRGVVGHFPRTFF